MDPRQQLAQLVPALTALVDCVEPSQLNNPTPCSRFTVHDVLDHMIVLGGSFAYLFRGEDPPETSPPPVYGWVPAAEFRKAMEDLLDAVTSPGAMERTISAPVGVMAGATFARFVAFDGLIHGWDIASATGLDYEPAADVVAAVHEFARSALTAEMRDGETFKNPTAASDDATPLQRVAAFSGRSLAPL